MKYRTLKSPVSVQIEVTEACDNWCRHCYTFFVHSTVPRRTMTMSQLDFVADELMRNQVVRATVTGGEPLTTPKQTLHLITRLHENGIKVGLNSTLTNFTREIGEKLQANGVKGILTSLIANEPEVHDYVTQRKGSWDKTNAGIKLAVEMGFRVYANMVLTNWNFHLLRETGDLAGQLGVHCFGATRCTAPVVVSEQVKPFLVTVEQIRESLAILHELQEKWGYQVDAFEHYPHCAIEDLDKYQYIARRQCTAGVTSATIGSDGQLRPCSHAPETYGNVFEEGLSKPWLAMTDWRERQPAEPCSTCSLFGISCSGGCLIDIRNTPEARDQHCIGESGIQIQQVADKVKPNFNGIFQFLPETVFRTEDFGGFVGSPLGKFILVGHDTYQLISRLSGIPFSYQLLTGEDYGVSESSSEQLITHLVSKGLVREQK